MPMARHAKRNIQPVKNNVSKDKLSVIIPAAGMGKRMKSYGPKPLIQVKNKTLFQNQLNACCKYLKPQEIILVVGFGAEKIIESVPRYISIVQNERYEETNVIRSIGLGLNASTGNKVVIIYGDLYFDPSVLKNFYHSKSAVLIDGRRNMGEGEVGCTIYDKQLENMTWNLPNKWAQIALFQNYELDLLREIANDMDRERWFGFEAINSIIDDGGIFYTQTTRRFVQDIDSTQDLYRVLSR